MYKILFCKEITLLTRDEEGNRVTTLNELEFPEEFSTVEEAMIYLHSFVEHLIEIPFDTEDPEKRDLFSSIRRKFMLAKYE